MDYDLQKLPFLIEAEANLNLEKCGILTKTMDSVGHVNLESCLYTTSPTTNAIKELNAPHNVTRVKFLLYLFHAFGLFVRRYASNAPLFECNLSED